MCIYNTHLSPCNITHYKIPKCISHSPTMELWKSPVKHQVLSLSSFLFFPFIFLAPKQNIAYQNLSCNNVYMFVQGVIHIHIYIYVYIFLYQYRSSFSIENFLSKFHHLFSNLVNFLEKISYNPVMGTFHFPVFINYFLFFQVIKRMALVVLVLVTILLRGAESRKTRILENFDYRAISCRAHTASLTEFGGVGDGKTSNTKAFQTAINKLSQYASDGGAQLFVPAGKWLTGSFSLTSHFTLFLHKDAVLLASQVFLSFSFSFLFF